jgi:hypothetical protein
MRGGIAQRAGAGEGVQHPGKRAVLEPPPRASRQLGGA